MALIQENVALAPYTTVGLGGPARYFTVASSIAEIQAALALAREKKLPIHILGGGSNTIFADEGFAGVVVAVALHKVSFDQDGRLTAAAGVTWDALVQAAIERGWAGLECLSGIPGLVGASPMQNVGAYGQDVAEVIEEVHALEVAPSAASDIRIRHVVLPASQCEFDYRTSRFKQAASRYIITAVRFRLRPGGAPTLRYPQLAAAVESETPTLKEVRQAVLRLRRSKSMVIDPADPNSRSCGSFFLNPVISKAHLAKLQASYPDIPFFTGEETPHALAAASWTGDGVKIPAAYLVEHSGFAKGLRRGGVGISAKHPLALVNFGGTADELLALADDIRRRVQEIFGIELVQEPVAVPYAPAVQ